MIKYKHFSFDLWLTLIKSNPLYKKERVKFIYNHYNFSRNTIDEISSVIRQVDLMCNQVNESAGKNLDSQEMYLMVFYLLNGSNFDYKSLDLSKFSLDMSNLVRKYPPVLLNNDVIPTLKGIKDSGKTINILSNTGFIKGKAVNEILSGLEINHFFDFKIYSDEEDLSKPNPALFDVLVENVKTLHNDANFKLLDIVHVGDNIIADIQGAQNIGLSAFLIHETNSIKNLMLHV